MFSELILNLISDVSTNDDYYVVVGDSNSLGGKVNLNNTLAAVIAILLLVTISAFCTIWIIIKRRQYLQVVQNALDEKEEIEKKQKAEEERLMQENQNAPVINNTNVSSAQSSGPSGVTVLPNINPRPINVGKLNGNINEQSQVMQEIIGVCSR